MLLYEDEKARAVFFFGNEGISREMLYPEFEAILDGIVPAVDWANREARAVYLEIDKDLLITAAVFFRIAFDKKGGVVSTWRLPLEDMARHASRGPDLGAGPIALACASQSPIAYYARDLWNPNMAPRGSHFAQLKKAVSRNRIGLRFRRIEDDETDNELAGGQLAELLEQRISQQLRRQYEQSFRDHMAQLIKEQRLRATTLAVDKEEALEELKRSHNQRLEALRAEVEERDRALAEERERNEQLKETIDGQARKIQGLREYFEHKLEKFQGEESDYVQALQENYAMELEAKVEAATTELKEMLQMRDVEILYRNEQEQQLRDEIARLRKENQELMGNSGGQLLEKLSEQGINYVTYRPGAGHITIPLSDIARYMDNPNQFAADYCGVSLDHYEKWLSHYQAPVCQVQACGASLPRTTNPTDFHPGESDVCDNCRANTARDALKLVR